MTLPPPDWLPAIGDRVRCLRVELGMSRAELARAAHIGRGSVRRMEEAHVAVQLQTVWQIAEALSVNVGDLVADPGRSRLDRR